MADENNESGRMKVVDKRMFTADGELREDFQHVGANAAGSEAKAAEPPREPRPIESPPELRPVEPSPAAAPPSSEPAVPPAENAAHAQARAEMSGAPGALGTPGFMDLVGILAEPVAIYLGDAKLPDGNSAEDLDAARFHIDLLQVVHSKTAGNLTVQESAVLDDLLYQLRMRYVRKRG